MDALRRRTAPVLLFFLLALGAGCGPDAPPPEATEEGTADPATAPGEVAPLSAPAFAEALEAGEAEIRVLYVRSTGFAGADDTGTLTGVTVEIMREFGRFVAEEYDLEVEVTFEEEPEWATFYRRVMRSEGGVFGIGNVTITEPRREELAFSPPYLSNIAILMTHENVPELGSLEESADVLGSMTGLLYPGTLHETRLLALRDEYLSGLETRTVTTNDELVGLVASGEGYFGFIDIYNYWRALEDGAPLRRHAVADDDSETFGVIMPHGSDWAEPMQRFFERGDGLRNTDWYRDLLRTHLGDELAGLLL